MAFWALELAKAFDLSLECHECKMSYFADDNKKCPYCDALRPAFLRALPHHLFCPFSLEHNDDTEYEAVPDFAAKTVFPVRGTKPFPDNLTFEFAEAAK
jgi:hypothetical protein